MSSNYAITLLSKLFNNELYSDICFVFGEQRVFAHKAILTQSCHFFGKLFTNQEYVSKKEIPVLCSMKVFVAVLKFIYTGTVNLNSLQDCDLFELFAICKQIDYELLFNKVARKMNEIEFKVEDVPKIYEFLNGVGCAELKEKLWKFIDLNARMVIKKETILSQFSFELMRDVVKRDTFEAPEIDIFKALLFCHEIHRTMQWKELFQFLRLSLISREHFATIVRPTRIFSDQQYFNAFGHRPRLIDGRFDAYHDREASVNDDYLFKKYFDLNAQNYASSGDVEMEVDTDYKSQSNAPNSSQEVVQDLLLTLEEVLHGGSKKFRIIKRLFSEDGKTIKTEEKVLTINLKPGWKEGTKIRFEKEGDQFPGRIPADIVFIVKDKPHKLFQRQGEDIKYTVKLQLLEALCGKTVIIPTLTGENESLSLNEIISPQTVKKIKNKGLPYPKDASRRGDLLVTFDVEYPKTLTDEKKNILLNYLS